MMTNNIIGGMRKNMANENKEKLVRKPGKKKTGIRKRENSNTNGYLFMLPYALMFVVFILLPTVLAVVLSFTNFNAIQFPKFVGFLNYITLITSDEVFMQYVLPNTVLYAVVVGIGGYILSFVLAWALCNLTKVPRTIFALILYSPSMTAGVAMTVLWKVIFSGDQTGLLNAWLMNLGLIDEPIIWLVNTKYLLPIVIIIGLWSSMGVGFLSMIAGILNSNEELYEAASLDGCNWWDKFKNVTLPCIKNVSSFVILITTIQAFKLFTQPYIMTGGGPNESTKTLAYMIYEQGFQYRNVGYSCAIAVIFFLVILLVSGVVKKVCNVNGD